MPNYQKMYTALFNQVSDAIELLKAAQQRTEEIYINEDEAEASGKNNNSPRE